MRLLVFLAVIISAGILAAEISKNYLFTKEVQTEKTQNGQMAAIISPTNAPILVRRKVTLAKPGPAQTGVRHCKRGHSRKVTARSRSPTVG